MPTMRFTAVPPPLETRVGQGLLAQLRSAIGFGVALHDQFNQTMHDDELADRTTEAVVDALRPGSLPFFLLLLMVVALVIHGLMVHSQANRILRDHGHFARSDGAGANGKAHAD